MIQKAGNEGEFVLQSEIYHIMGERFPVNIFGDAYPDLTWSLVQHTLELTPAGNQQRVTDLPIDLEAFWLETNRPSSSVDFVIGELAWPVTFGPA